MGLKGFDKAFAKMWSAGKKIDLLGVSDLMENQMRLDSKLVREGAKFGEKNTGGKLSKWFGGLENEAERNRDDPVRGIGRAALTAGAVMGGMYAAGAAGGGGAASSGAGTITGGSGLSAGSAGLAGGAGETLGVAGTGLTAGTGATGLSTAMSSGTATSLGTTGLGVSGQTGAGLGGSKAGLSAMDKFNMARSLGNSIGQMGQGAPDNRPLYRADEGDGDWAHALDEYDDEFATSTKQAKKPASGGLADAVRKGLSGEDPISANGIEIAAIQALLKRMDKVQKLIDARKKS